MVRVQCRTNLDIKHHAEKWPTHLCERPVVGDLIRSAQVWQRWGPPAVPYQLELMVCRCVWVQREQDGILTWTLDVELTLPSSRFASINDFNKWYNEVAR